ncbi:MAG: lipid-A-disaccharide synthase [Methylococcales symbiont of Iophon sp. n. MRB-2018]|nr:MAG: lipid-A-disaccharide synthase [Methylococcales symbiont of Iophon sp. n. MRB-2018]KAF3980392.1 MAG: lipid-A-disaccharide synthase [Methylococcales symbiont of Iophon sp. n. MRB-2018]
MFSAGESSGDQHAANMFNELKKLSPSIQGLGMGSKKMQQAGIKLSFDSSGIAVIGLIEVLKHYGEIRWALKLMKKIVAREKPDLLVCVDYKEFNLKLARFAKKQGIKVLFYISPQIWAWREDRVVTYGKAIDMMAVIFPFESAYYEAENIPVNYVGHPSVDKVHAHGRKIENAARFSIKLDKPVIGIVPGSRINEIKRMLPIMLAAAEQIAKVHNGAQFILPQANSIKDDLLQGYLSKSAVKVIVIKNQPYEVIQCCDAIMTTSGTASLEIALLQVPMVIAYKLSAITYYFAKKLVKTKFIGLPNIIAGKGIIKELIQVAASKENLAAEVHKILENTVYRTTMLNDLAEVKKKLGKGGGSKNMAVLALQMINPDC